jgi:molybdopterin-guanine dinucleotide biosynthesis protein A
MIAGLILAGGKSSRMGSDKSYLTLPDSQQSLLEHCLKNMAKICNNRLFVSGPQHEQGIADVYSNCGPLSGIHAAISYIEAEHEDVTELLVVAVDMPDLRHEDLSYLLQAGRNSKRLCCFENCFLPLYIPLSSAVTGYLYTTLKPQVGQLEVRQKKPQYSIKNMLNTLQGKQISPLYNSQLSNINTLDQWQRRCANQPFIKV